MSIEALTTVWSKSRHEGGTLLVLLALADSANDEGYCWPSMQTIAHKARLSERHTRRVVRELEESGELRSEERFASDGQSSNGYWITLRADIMSGGPGVAGVREGEDADDPRGVTPTSARTVKGTVSSEPSEKDLALPGLESPVTEIWNHYLGYFGDKVRVRELTAPREKTIKKALDAVGGDVGICKLAIEGLKSYRAAHPDKSQNTDLSVIFQTGPQSRGNLTELIEFWSSQAGTTASIDPSVPSVLRDRIIRRRIEVVQMHKTDDESVRERGEDALAWLKEHAHEQPVVVDGRVTGWTHFTTGV